MQFESPEIAHPAGLQMQPEDLVVLPAIHRRFGATAR